MRRHTLLLVGIIFLGLLLRLFILSQRGSFWFDEAFSTHFAAMDVGQMLHYLRFENNPPFYFILLNFWMKLFGTSELAGRMLSMIFGVAAIPLVYWVGVRLFPPQRARGGEEEGLRPAHNPPQPSLILREGDGRTAGLFAAFLMAISPFQVFYSTETRMYSLYVFLTLVVVWLVYRSQELGIRNQESGGGSIRRFIIHNSLFIILLLLVWTHITAWFIVFAMTLYLFWQAKFSPKQFALRYSGFVLTTVLVFFSFLPWAINFIQIKTGASLTQGYFFYYPAGKNYILELFETFLIFGEKNAFVVTFLSVLTAILLWYAVKNRTKAGLLLGCWLAVPLGIGLAFNNAIPRYFIAVAPALYLLLGVGYANLCADIRQRSFAESTPHRAFALVRGLRMTRVLVPLLFFALIITNYPSLAAVSRHRWDEAAGWVQEHGAWNMEHGARSFVLISPHSEVLSFERYYRGTLPVVGFYPQQDTDDRDMRIVKTNWVSLITKENIPRLRDATEGFQQVFLITGGIDTDTVGQNLLLSWFWDNGWKRQETKEFGQVIVTVMAR